MHDTRTVFRSDVIAGNDAERTFSGVDPREEGFVLQSDEVGAFVASDNLCVWEIGRETCFCKDDMAILRRFNLHVVNLRSYT